MAASEAEFHALMARLHQGDEDAAAIIVQRFGGDMLGMVRRYRAPETRSALDSSDIVQSVWRSFFTHALPTHEFADERELRQFLRRLSRSKTLDANHRYLDSQRRDLRRASSLDELSAEVRQRLVDPNPSPAEVVQAEELLEALTAGLPPRYRPIVALLRDGYSHQEISERVGCTERAVGRVVERLLQLPHWISSVDPS